jgi:hypothetical protein
MVNDEKLKIFQDTLSHSTWISGRISRKTSSSDRPIIWASSGKIFRICSPTRWMCNVESIRIENGNTYIYIHYLLFKMTSIFFIFTRKNVAPFTSGNDGKLVSRFRWNLLLLNWTQKTICASNKHWIREYVLSYILTIFSRRIIDYMHFNILLKKCFCCGY